MQLTVKRCLCRYLDQPAQELATTVQAPVDGALGTEGSPDANLDAGVTALHAAIEASLSCTVCYRWCQLIGQGDALDMALSAAS